jgi:uncharacterized protein with von Willebrand factor type A (vWA) domain
MTITAEPLLTTEQLIRECYDECTVPQVAADAVTLDLPALATAFARRLRDAGMTATASQCERYARSLELTAPASRGALYWTTRAAFVTGPHEVATLDRVFRDVFGAGDGPLGAISP